MLRVASSITVMRQLLKKSVCILNYPDDCPSYLEAIWLTWKTNNDDHFLAEIYCQMSENTICFGLVFDSQLPLVLSWCKPLLAKPIVFILHKMMALQLVEVNDNLSSKVRNYSGWSLWKFRSIWHLPGVI